ncbi:hypothetical protein ACX0G7_08310 [Flavitalea antarctica]
MTNLNHTDKQAEPGTQKKEERPKLPVDETGEPIFIQDDPDIIPPPEDELETTPPYEPPPPAEGP